MKVIKPPHNIANRNREYGVKNIFLAGTIDMGNSEDWQSQMIEELNSYKVNIFNPRRDEWDSSWEQKYENPQFYQQVVWELNALEQSDIIVLYLAPESKSPISLLELGLHARSEKLMVICPDGFYRKGNVDIVCDMYEIPLFKSIFEAKLYLVKKLENNLTRI